MTARLFRDCKFLKFQFCPVRRIPDLTVDINSAAGADSGPTARRGNGSAGSATAEAEKALGGAKGADEIRFL
jgi:hypothetical protein